MKNESKIKISFLNPYYISGSLGLQKGMSVADFGSGAGHFAMAIAREVGDSGIVYAIDARQSALEVLGGHIKLDGLFQIKTIHANLEAENGSTLGAESQDKVLCSNILHQVDSTEAVLKEAYRVLKPRGELIILDWREKAPFGPKERFSKESAQSAAKQAGFKMKSEFNPADSHYGLIFMK